MHEFCLEKTNENLENRNYFLCVNLNDYMALFFQFLFSFEDRLQQRIYLSKATKSFIVPVQFVSFNNKQFPCNSTNEFIRIANNNISDFIT